MSNDRGDALNPDAKSASSNSTLAPELMHKWLDNQSQEVAAKAKETELSFQQDSNAFEFAKLSLASQERDRQADRTCTRKTRQDSFLLIGILVLLLVVVVSIALFLGKDAVAMEIIKDIGILVSGALGGYGIGRVKAQDKASDSAS